MENYDNWKSQTPNEPKENECNFCGEETNSKYCSTECQKAYEIEN